MFRIEHGMTFGQLQWGPNAGIELTDQSLLSMFPVIMTAVVVLLSLDIKVQDLV